MPGSRFALLIDSSKNIICSLTVKPYLDVYCFECTCALMYMYGHVYVFPCVGYMYVYVYAYICMEGT